MQPSVFGSGEDSDRSRQSGSIIAAAIGAVFRELDGLIPVKEPSKPPVVQLLTFADAVRYFVNNQPEDPRIQAGALLRRPHAAGHLVFQVFLDETDNVCVGTDRRPYGRVLVARHLDDEL